MSVPINLSQDDVTVSLDKLHVVIVLAGIEKRRTNPSFKIARRDVGSNKYLLRSKENVWTIVGSWGRLIS